MPSCFPHRDPEEAAPMKPRPTPSGGGSAAWTALRDGASARERRRRWWATACGCAVLVSFFLYSGARAREASRLTTYPLALYPSPLQPHTPSRPLQTPSPTVARSHLQHRAILPPPWCPCPGRYNASNIALAINPARASTRNRFAPIAWAELPMWLSTRLRSLPASFRERCTDAVLYGNDSWAWEYQDVTLFRSFFFDLPGPMAYLDLSADDAEYSSPTAFFDLCLGWKGVAREPCKTCRTGWAQKRTARLVPSCMDSWRAREARDGNGRGKATCLTLEEILRTNADVLGKADNSGALGTNIGFVSVSFKESYYTILDSVMSCTDIEGLFSNVPLVQVWLVGSRRADNHRVVETSLLFAGFQGSGVLDTPNDFVNFWGHWDDIYVRRSGDALESRKHLKAENRCRNGNRTCSIVQRFNTAWPSWSGPDYC